MTRRVSVFDREEADKKHLEIIQQELDKGTNEGYGRGLLYTYFRTKGFLVSRDRLFQVDSTGVERRTRDLQFGGVILRGPKAVWL
ncbi:hypothetical protein LPUS_00753 [Lasallia pustulata]|uniref:Uncharacterized protein n=1 Tax=Lasallia pustulata TaxID=136370 RepID=A0A1W5D311_9LECA|nr:hypothetical protein LPUS_00753 [Lasallia pustulata]